MGIKILHREFLPSLANSVHASTIAFFRGNPVFAWFEGIREGDPGVYVNVCNIGGKKESIKIGSKDGIPRWNPVLFTHGDELFLFVKAGLFCDRWQTYLYNMTNWDATTTEKEINSSYDIIPSGLNACVKTKPIFLNDKMFCGSSVETFDDWSAYIEAYEIKNSRLKYLFRSNPLTVAKKRYSNPYSGATRNTLGVIQPSLWLDGNGKMKAVMRSSYGLGKIYYSSSLHPFIEWEEPMELDIPNPNSSIDVAYVDGRLFLVCNPVEIGRLPLTLIELDDNMRFVQSLDITTNVDSGCISNEASYPYLILHDGKLHLTYTYGRSRIEFCVLDIN